MITFCGCASVNYSFYELEDGSYQQTIEVEIDEEEVLAKGGNLTEIKNIVETNIKKYFVAYENRFNAYVSSLGVDYLLATRIRSCVVLTSNWVNETTYIGAIIYKGYSFIPLITSGEEYSYQTDPSLFNKSSDEIYNFFWTGSFVNESQPNIETVKTTFTQTTVQKSQTIFSGTDEIVNEILSQITQGSFTKQDVNYVYNYATSSSRLHTNSDMVHFNGTDYVHTWNLNPDSSGKDILFYRTYAITVWWYVLGIGASLVFVSVLFIINYVNEKKKKKQIDNPVVEIIEE